MVALFKLLVFGFLLWLGPVGWVLIGLGAFGEYMRMRQRHHEGVIDRMDTCSAGRTSERGYTAHSPTISASDTPRAVAIL